MLCPKIKPLYLTINASMRYINNVLRNARSIILESGIIPKMDQGRPLVRVAVPDVELNFTDYNHWIRCT